jgi:hypothetical protein
VDRLSFSPAAPAAIGAALAIPALSVFPTLHWLCLAVDALITRIFG